MNRLSMTAAVLGLGISLGTAQAREAYTIKDTSFRDEFGQRVQQLVLDVDASPAEVWKALTTDEGIKRWAAPIAHVDLMNGGMWESSYSLSSHIGDRENIRNQIIAYVPGRLLVFHNVHVPKGAPPDFALLPAIRTILQIEPLGHGRARVTQSGVGYGEGAGFDGLYAHFNAGNRFVFEGLAKALTGKPVDWQAEADKAKASVGDKSK